MVLPSSSSLHDAASVARDKINDVVQAIQSNDKNTLKDGFDSLFRTMFAPCTGVTGDMGAIGGIGGVPRNEIGGFGGPGPVAPERSSSAPGPRIEGSFNSNGWASSVPFEVATKTPSDDSNDENDQLQAATPGASSATPSSGVGENKPLTVMEQKQARSRAKLRQLGAQHQLASGVFGDSLADVARPVSPERPREENAPDFVDFDDGISAISSHTLEEMERRRNPNYVRVTHLDFTKQSIDENDDQESGFEQIFGNPFPIESGNIQQKESTSSSQWVEMLVSNDGNQGTVVQKSSSPDVVFNEPFELARGQSTNTKGTNITEDTEDFQRVWMADEARYWANEEKEQSNTRLRRSVGRPSVEERARRLRELSRSRSRSDGTGSSNKFGSSPLLDVERHPFDTVPLYASDVVSKPKKSSQRSRQSQRSINQSRHLSDTKILSSKNHGGNTALSLDYGEI